MLHLYRFLVNIILLISPLIIILRIFKKKESPTRFKEKFCIFSKKRNKGNLVWFHGSSVGEILSIIPLIEKFEKDKKIKNILITSSTLSSSFVLSKFKFKKTIHQFFPLDTNYFSKKFLKYWKPSLAIFIESEIWPNTLLNIKNSSIPLVLLNGRITKKAFNRWIQFPSITNKIFGSFDATYPQNLETQKYLKKLGAKKIKVKGNLKFSESQNIKKKINNPKLKKLFLSKKTWCAASTHKGEELLCGLVHKTLKNNHKNLITIIIPRHINRVNEISEELKNLNLNIHIHSSKNKLKKNTDIYLVDTYGESKIFFQYTNTVFLGGSVIEHGGQNPLEPARFGCKILHGPNINNFKEVYTLLKKNKISYNFYNQNNLIVLLNKLLSNKKSSKKTIKKLKIIGKNILENTFNELKNYIKLNNEI